jgi:predicted nucleic acid-binding Zn ribbon protein
MVERIAQHRHCKECDKAIPYKDKYCDETCEAAWKKKMVAILVMAIVLGLVGSR